MSTTIFFDLDGTVYDLYEIKNWLEMLETEKSEVFKIGNFIGDYKAFSEICNKLLSIGVKFEVITWLPMNASTEYEIECTTVKRIWVNKFLPFISNFTAQSYGTPKQNAITKRAKQLILIDDNSEVCTMWNTNKMRTSYNINKKDFTVINALTKIYNDLTK